LSLSNSRGLIILAILPKLPYASRRWDKLAHFRGEGTAGAQHDRLVQELISDCGREVVLLADETKGPITSPPDIRKIRIDPGAQGLYTTPDVMWRCGDYALYAALEGCPEADFFWLIEPDVRVHTTAIRSMFDGVDATRETDFVTAWFVASSPEWAWYKSMQPFAGEIFNCMLQLARFSRRSLIHLLQRRREISILFCDAASDPGLWPNDEAFVAAVLVAGGFSVATFADHAPSFQHSGTFTFTKPTSLRWLSQEPPNNRLYHPVVSGPSFLRRARDYLREKEATNVRPDLLVAEFGLEFLRQVELEGGTLAATAFYGEVKAAASRLAKHWGSF
jgi:hypothetical protein